MSTADHGRSADLDALAAAALGQDSGIRPPAGLPDPLTLDEARQRAVRGAAGAVDSVSGGPSQGGFGASPTEVGGSAAPHVAAPGFIAGAAAWSDIGFRMHPNLRRLQGRD